MKSIVYILIAVFVSSIFFSAFPRTDVKQQEEIYLQCVNQDYSQELLKLSSSIFESRLSDYGIQGAKVYFNEQKELIKVLFDSPTDLPMVKSLLTSKGQLEFYEVYDRQNFIETSGIDKTLSAMLNISEKNPDLDRYSGILGYCKADKKQDVKDYIEKHYVSALGKGLNFYWSEQADKDGYYQLFLLQNKAALNNSHVARSFVNYNAKSHSYELMINFDKQAASQWQDISQRNIGKSIAIVLDQEVLQSPRVMSEITGGKCAISGNFSEPEIKRISALIMNQALPLDFELVE